MNEKAAEKLGLKPGGFGRHQASCIRHSEQLSDRGGVHEEGYAVIGIGFLFQLSGDPDTTHKLNPGVSFRVADSQDRSEDAGLKDGDVKTCDGVV